MWRRRGPHNALRLTTVASAVLRQTGRAALPPTVPHVGCKHLHPREGAFATPCGDVWACGDMNYDVIAESKCRGAYYDARAQYRYRQTSHVTPVRCLSDSHLSLDSLESRHKSLVSRSLMSHVSHTLTTPPSPKCAHSHFCVLHRRDEQTTPHTRCQRLRRATARRARGQSRRFRSRSAPMRLLRGW